MENTPESYHISFFKPTTERALANRNMVLWLVSVWVVAIFGFHILLKVIEKPVPEPAYTAFQTAWSNLENGSNAPADYQAFAQSCLSLAGRIETSDAEKECIDHAFSWSLYQLAGPSGQDALVQRILEFEGKSQVITSIGDEDYIRIKLALVRDLSPLVGLSDLDVRKTVVPFALRSEGIADLGEDTRVLLPELMGKFLIHNQSVLTDTPFLGFPFHYFYTAVFLLILFIGLCLIYCIRTDALNKKINIAD